MRRTYIGLVLSIMTSILVVLGISHAASAAADETELKLKEQILQQERKCVQMIDVDQVMRECYDSQDPDLLLYDAVPGREFRGTEAIRNHIIEFVQKFHDLEVKYDYVNVVVGSDMAVTTDAFHASATYNGKKIKFALRNTDVWRKKGDAWRIIHTHTSAPVVLETGRAVLDSK